MYLFIQWLLLFLQWLYPIEPEPFGLEINYAMIMLNCRRFSSLKLYICSIFGHYFTYLYHLTSIYSLKKKKRWENKSWKSPRNVWELKESNRVDLVSFSTINEDAMKQYSIHIYVFTMSMPNISFIWIRIPSWKGG
jgi:hypothetical protein